LCGGVGEVGAIAVRIALLTMIGCVLGPPVLAAPIPCSDIPAAQHFVDGLRPGPNTREAQRHLDAAKRAKSEKDCDAELRQVDTYARRSAAADKAKAAAKPDAPPRKRAAAATPCADLMHQDRPGGTDYKGPKVADCK
jgi:hypothetical protein